MPDDALRRMDTTDNIDWNNGDVTHNLAETIHGTSIQIHTNNHHSLFLQIIEIDFVEY